MNLKSKTTACAFVFGAIVLGGVAFAESAAEARRADTDAKDADTPLGQVQDLREQMSVLMSRAASAQSTQEEITVLKAQLSVIMARLEELSKREQEKAKQPVDAAKPAADTPKPPADAAKKPEPVPAANPFKGFYGTMDVSFDDTTKGIEGKVATQYALANFPPDQTTLVSSIHTPPVGRLGYMPALSTNKSNFGYRGDHTIGTGETKFIFQIEAGLAITASPGLNTTYVQQANVVRSGVGFGDSFIGLSNKDWGSLKFGTVYSPYKKSTDRLNPFSGLLGDYTVVMGNTGGDNRVEFGTRLDHSVWYESPKLGPGFSLDVLFSPGQNRTFDNIIQSAGSPDCNGGNEPGSGNLPLNCDDGGFSDAFSAALKFDNSGFYGTVAYELHHNVNRNSDGIGSNNFQYQIFAFNNPDLVVNANNNPQGLPPQALGGYVTDIGDETAFKVGLQYRFPFKLTLGGIWEHMRRSIPAYLAFQNERSRDGEWVAATQEIGEKGSLSVGWAHAGKTPGDPGGQHNYNPLIASESAADMYTVAYKHKLDKQFTFYLDWALTVNHGNAHYDLGAGGRGLVTDCHDGTSTAFVDYSSGGPTTWGGCRVQGFSIGMNYRF